MTPPMRLAATILLVLMAGCQASPPPLSGEVSGQVQLGGRTIPLPPGPWTVLGQDADTGRTRDGINTTTVHRATLVQEKNGQAVALLQVASASEAGSVWLPHGICVNRSTLARTVDIAIPGELRCHGVSVGNSGSAGTPPAAVQALYAAAIARPGWLPPRWLVSYSLLNRQHEYLSMELLLAPSVLAVGAEQETVWSRGRMTAAQTAFVQRLEAWTVAIQPSLEQSLAHRAAAPLPAPF